MFKKMFKALELIVVCHKQSQNYHKDTQNNH